MKKITPAGKADIEALRETLRREISEEELSYVVGGNDDLKPKDKTNIPWVCPFCGATIILRQFEDGPKHLTKCPENPYKNGTPAWFLDDPDNPDNPDNPDDLDT